MTTIPLPEHFDTRAAAALAPDLRVALADGGTAAIVLNGGPVERIGQAGLQLLVSARRTADAAGRSLSIEPASAGLRAAATLTGADTVLWSDAALLSEGTRDAA